MSVHPVTPVFLDVHVPEPNAKRKAHGLLDDGRGTPLTVAAESSSLYDPELGEFGTHNGTGYAGATDGEHNLVVSPEGHPSLLCWLVSLADCLGSIDLVAAAAWPSDGTTDPFAVDRWTDQLLDHAQAWFDAEHDGYYPNWSYSGLLEQVAELGRSLHECSPEEAQATVRAWDYEGQRIFAGWPVDAFVDGSSGGAGTKLTKTFFE